MQAVWFDALSLEFFLESTLIAGNDFVCRKEISQSSQSIFGFLKPLPWSMNLLIYILKSRDQAT